MARRGGLTLPKEYRGMLAILAGVLVLLWLATRSRHDGDTLLGQFAEDLAKVALVLVAAWALFAAPWWIGGAAAGVALRATVAGTALASLLAQAFGDILDGGGPDDGGGAPDPCVAAGHGRTVLVTTDPQGDPLHRCENGTYITP
jgi:hypothetical protein